MPSFNTQELLSGLENDVTAIINQAKTLQSLNSALCNQQPAPAQWSIAQVIEHLNCYNRFYLAEIENAIKNGGHTISAPAFNPGLFGNYFTKIMKPGVDGKIANKMNAPKGYNPPPALDAAKVLAEFIVGQQLLIKLLQDAKKVNIGKLRVPISISRFIKLKLGDTFRFLIAHQQRHMLQANRVLNHLTTPQLQN